MKNRVLLVSHSSGVYGAEKCLFSLAKGLHKDHYRVVVSCPGAGPLWDKLGESGIPRTYLPTRNWMSTEFRFLRSIKRIPSQMFNTCRALLLLKVRKFDLVHCNSITSLEAAVAAKILRVPVVIHCREMLKGNPSGFFAGWKRAYRIADGLGNKVICISKAVQQQMLEAGCREENMVVIYDSFEMSYTYSAPLEMEPPSDRESSSNPVIGCVAGIHPRKGHPTLLRAFSIVKRSIPNARLIIVGDGMASYVHEIKALASRLGIDSATQFVGEVGDVGPFYRQFAVLAVPSFAEAFGLVYGEAAVFGIPAIGTSDGGAPEIIEDGVTGFIVPPEDPQRLAQAMLTILENPKLAKEMGRCAKERVLRLFSSCNYIKGVENVYRDVLARQT